MINIEKYKNRVLEVLNYGSWEEINWEEISALDLLSEQD